MFTMKSQTVHLFRRGNVSNLFFEGRFVVVYPAGGLLYIFFLRIKSCNNCSAQFLSMKAPKRKKKSESIGAFFLQSSTCLEIKKKKKHSPFCSLSDVMSWSHARRGGEPGSCCNCPCRRMGQGGRGGPTGLSGPRFTSPLGWVPYCWGCPVTERTKKSRRCPRSSRESPIQRKTPEQTEATCQNMTKYSGFYFENLVVKAL